MPGGVGLVIAAVFLVVSLALTVGIAVRRYKVCPSDMILVVFGNVGGGQASLCLHGGGKFVWPVIQKCSYLSLVPLTISIPLQNALSMQNIRINVPSTFTVGISINETIMTNAAERLLELTPREIEEMAREIIFGQLRLTVASLTIEEINKDRERFLSSIRNNVEPELNKIGLYLINVNITDITDESEYIENIGKKAASTAINRARIDVAEQEKLGAVGESENNRERTIRVAENEAGAEKGRKQAEADQRVFVQEQEAIAIIGEARANRDRDIHVAENIAEAEKGKKKAEADRRVFVQAQEADAIAGENKAKADIADANAKLAVKEAEARKIGEVARRQAIVDIQKAQYVAEEQRLNAEEIIQKEIERRKIEIAAEAEGEKLRRVARGEADATLAKYEAEAKGIRQVLESKAAGYGSLVDSCRGDSKAVATLLMIERIEEIVSKQVEAIKNLKIDKITVWDSGGGGNGGSSTANFASSLIKSLPPLHDIAQMAGVELPGYLGRIVDQPESDGAPPEKAPVPTEQGE